MSDRLVGARVLVTGGRGFIGRRVVGQLRDQGARPVVIAHPSLDASGGSEEVIRLDLDDSDGLAEASNDVDAIVHLAARSGGIQFQEDGGDIRDLNRRMTHNVLSAARAAGVGRVFLASSLVVYLPSTRPLVETDPVVEEGDPGATPYALSKVGDEREGLGMESIEVVVGRFGNVYGPGATFDPARATVVHSLMDRAATTDDGPLVVWGDGSAVRSFVFVEDVAAAVVQILAHGAPGGVYNVDSGVPVTIGELAARIRDVVAPDLELQFDPTKPAGAPYRVGAIDALSGIGFEPETTLDAGIEQTFDWYRASRG